MLQTLNTLPGEIKQTPTQLLVPSVSSSPPIIEPNEEHPVFGRAPIGKDGFSLENQMIEMLDFWHQKATAICTSFPDEDFNDAARRAKYEEASRTQWDIYRAALKAELNSASRVARLLTLIVRHTDYNGSTDELDELRIIKDALVKVTAPLEPTKHIGPLTRGNKLTRAGLLYRYHAFLIGELQTLGWNFYGNRDYPARLIPHDDAVTARTSNYYANGKLRRRHRGKSYPFFDESKLTARARSVLKSLKIDTEKAEH